MVKMERDRLRIEPSRKDAGDSERSSCVESDSSDDDEANATASMAATRPRSPRAGGTACAAQIDALVNDERDVSAPRVPMRRKARKAREAMSRNCQRQTYEAPPCHARRRRDSASSRCVSSSVLGTVFHDDERLTSSSRPSADDDDDASAFDDDVDDVSARLSASATARTSPKAA